jgi:sugar phosphate isomerase/epimerase
MEVDAAALVHAAADAGLEHVCIFTEVPVGVTLTVPLVTSERAGELRRLMSARGISAYNLEIFFLTAETDVRAFRSALELGASLGGRRATVIISDPDERRAADNFAAFCALTETFGISAGLEFMIFSEVKTLAQARRIVELAGHPNGSIAVDVLHLMRTGSSPQELRQLDPKLIGYVQLCDGPSTPPADLWLEAVENRMVPGEGEFPLREFLAAIPAERTISLEVPLNRRLASGEDVKRRAHILVDAARRLMGVRA